MDLYVHVVESHLGHMVIDERDHIFISRYAAILIGYDLVRIDFDWFDAQEKSENMVGHFLGPISARGRTLLDYLMAVDEGLNGPLSWHRPQAVQERFVRMSVEHTFRRSEFLRRFESQLKKLVDH